MMFRFKAVSRVLFFFLLFAIPLVSVQSQEVEEQEDSSNCAINPVLLEGQAYAVHVQAEDLQTASLSLAVPSRAEEPLEGTVQAEDFINSLLSTIEQASGQSAYGFSETPKLLVVDDFTTPFRREGYSTTHGDLVLELINTLAGATGASIQIDTIDVGGVGWTTEGITEELRKFEIQGATVVNMSFALIPCEFDVDGNTFNYYDFIGYAAEQQSEVTLQSYFETMEWNPEFIRVMVQQSMDSQDDPLQSFIVEMIDTNPDTFWVASAGNSAVGVGADPYAPAAWEHVISVSGYTPTTGNMWWTNFYDVVGYSHNGRVSAPAAWYYTGLLDNHVAGTSFAAPVVSVTIAADYADPSYVCDYNQLEGGPYLDDSFDNALISGLCPP